MGADFASILRRGALLTQVAVLVCGLEHHRLGPRLLPPPRDQGPHLGRSAPARACSLADPKADVVRRARPRLLGTDGQARQLPGPQPQVAPPQVVPAQEGSSPPATLRDLQAFRGVMVDLSPSSTLYLCHRHRWGPEEKRRAEMGRRRPCNCSFKPILKACLASSRFLSTSLTPLVSGGLLVRRPLHAPDRDRERRDASPHLSHLRRPAYIASTPSRARSWSRMTSEARQARCPTH